MRTRVSERSYYDGLPTREHKTGDIWQNVPTQGLLPNASLPGLVITPACDLAQSKVETITYLPIVPIRLWIGSSSFHAEAIRQIRSEATLLGLADSPLLDPELPFPASLTHIAAFEALIRACAPSSVRHREAVSRCEAGACLLRMRGECHDGSVLARKAKGLLGDKGWGQLVRQLLTNYRRDMHFLPADRFAEWSILHEHSLVLFRYPLTAPVSIFDAAQDTTIGDWTAWIEQNSAGYPLASSFRDSRPLKGLRLKKDFLADLLTRYAGLYIRLGSPDFSRETVEQFADELEP